MVKMHVMYEDDLHTIATHLPSGSTLHTDAPEEVGGTGQTFSPTDLLAVSLASCIATVLGMHAKKRGLDFRGLHIDIEKIMSKDKPRRISKITMHIKIPVALPEEEQKLVENAAHSCPVFQSLHPELDQEMYFEWKENRN